MVVREGAILLCCELILLWYHLLLDHAVLLLKGRHIVGLVSSVLSLGRKLLLLAGDSGVRLLHHLVLRQLLLLMLHRLLSHHHAWVLWVGRVVVDSLQFDLDEATSSVS